MPINLKDFFILEKYDGNGANKIFKVEHVTTKQIFVIKIIKITNLQTQLKEIEIHK